MWLIKNIIVSGCIIYPVKITCVENLSWTNIQQISNANIESEAWAKGWPDRIDKNVSMEQFNKNFTWIGAWSKKHLNYILNIVIPYITILSFIALYIKIKFKSIIVKNNKDLNFVFFVCLITSGAGTIFFLFLFPLYRYGYSYIITLISLIFILIIKVNLKSKENISIFKFIFISCFVVIGSKQGIRIFDNHKNSPWPNIYTLDSNGKIYSKTKMKIDNDFLYYLADKGDKLCMYSNSPCSTYTSENLKFSLKKTYTFLTIK